MAESLVGPITEKLMEKLLDIGFNYLKDQVTWQTGMKEKLERLQENQDKIRAVVSASIQAQNIDQNTEINNWIWRLRDAFDEADDVLDDFEYMKHKEQLATNKVRSTMTSLKKFGKRALKFDPTLKRLKKVVNKLDKISAEVINFRDLLKDTQQEQKVQQDNLQNNRETGSMPKDVLIGRSQDKEFVIQWLGKLPNEEHQSHVLDIPNIYHNISLLSIVGHGGMGKTTLLQHVYKDKVTEEFDLKMWVCVSNNFDVKKVIIDMLESIQNSRPSLDTLHKLQENLKSAVESKKFLLVLDDIWEENEEGDRSKWENVLAPLAYGGLGSKILITTRMDSIASMIAKVIKKQNESLLTLKGLEKDECLQLLNTCAFAGMENPNDHMKLRSITEKLVKKLFGSPLAAKVIGGVLNSNLDERHWTNILSNVMGYNGMFPILKLSYIFLPKYLQNCFAFCSIFAQDHVFDEDDLVRMWIAVGFIQPSNIQGEDLEDIGRRFKPPNTLRRLAIRLPYLRFASSPFETVLCLLFLLNKPLHIIWLSLALLSISQQGASAALTTSRILKHYARLASKLALRSKLHEFLKIVEGILASDAITDTESSRFITRIEAKMISGGIAAVIDDGRLEDVLDFLCRADKLGIKPLSLIDGSAIKAIKAECGRLMYQGDLEEFVRVMEILAGKFWSALPSSRAISSICFNSALQSIIQDWFELYRVHVVEAEQLILTTLNF